MPRPWRPVPEPLDVDANRIIIAGTVLWFVGFLVLVVFVGRLRDADALVWLWTCLAGWVLGLLGLYVAIRQRRG